MLAAGLIDSGSHSNSRTLVSLVQRCAPRIVLLVDSALQSLAVPSKVRSGSLVRTGHLEGGHEGQRLQGFQQSQEFVRQATFGFRLRWGLVFAPLL